MASKFKHMKEVLKEWKHYGLITLAEGGDMHMESALTDIDGKIGRDVKEVYVGPSALWIAKLIPRRVSFSQGWFWTTTEICHEGRSDGLAFRQRPDGNGIDVRCHTRGCSRDVAMAGLETATGLSIQNAYAPTGRPVDRLWWLKHWPWERLAWWGTAALAFAAPLLVGLGLQAAILNCLGYGIGSWLTGRLLLRRPARRSSR